MKEDIVTRSHLYSSLVLVGCMMVAACASDSPADRQRSVYSYENTDLEPNRSGRQYRVDEPPPSRSNDPYSGRYGR